MIDRDIYKLENVKKLYNYFCEFYYPKESFLYYKHLEIFLEEMNLKETDLNLYRKYHDYLIGLKFLSLSSLNWEEIEDLFKKHFNIIFSIKYYELWSKLEMMLLELSDFKKRDEKKENLKNILFKSENRIINKQKYKKINLIESVADWLKDYIRFVGLGKVDKVKKNQYLVASDNIKALDQEDRFKIRALIDLYEKLNYSSENDPRGLDESILFNHDGRDYVLSRNGVEDLDKYSRMLKGLMDLNEKQKGAGDDLENNDLVNEIKSLEEQKENYPLNSLERRAIEEEIKKLSKKEE